MTSLHLELSHLVRISSTPAWEEYATWKAKQYARQFPEYADLPRLLKEAMQPKPAKDTSTDTQESE